MEGIVSGEERGGSGGDGRGGRKEDELAAQGV